MRLLPLLLLAGLAPAAGAAALADNVVLVANSDDPDSVAIARHYAEVRGVPAENVLAFGMPRSETITWRQFVASVWQPVQDELVRREWIDGMRMDLLDAVGRRKYSIAGHRIAALVTCRGVPLRIENDPSLLTDYKPYTDRPQFRTNAGAVDSELSLLAQSDYPINAGVPNPFFANLHPTLFTYSQVVKVSRLDGPTASDALHLVDLAVEAERTGLLGRAYVDIAGPHESGDRWLAAAASTLAGLGYDLTVTRGHSTMGASARFDAPALYFGWYTQDMSGPFLLPGFRFPPGAVAVHIHSFSAGTLRSATEGWCGPMIGRGATATLGNVYEPYLEYLHRPDLFAEALARGDDLVDAAYYALPLLSWQSIVIGDPLYRPFAVSALAEVNHLASLPRALAGYAVIRQMNLLGRAGRTVEALELGRSGMRNAPSLPLALALSRMDRAEGGAEEPAGILAAAAQEADAATGNWGVLREAAAFLAGSRHFAESLAVYRRLLAIEMIPPEARAPWLAEARRVALAAGDTAQAGRWEEEAGRIAERSISPGP